MERLTAFEFIPAQREGLHLVRLKRRDDTILLTLAFAYWCGVDLSALALTLDSREDLVIEGEGVGHPYWNDEATPWTQGFDPQSEIKRIEAIRAAVQREVNRVLIGVH